MAKIDVKFMKGNRELAKAMGSTYGKKKKSTTKKTGGKSNGNRKK